MPISSWKNYYYLSHRLEELPMSRSHLGSSRARVPFFAYLVFVFLLFLLPRVRVQIVSVCVILFLVERDGSETWLLGAAVQRIFWSCFSGHESPRLVQNTASIIFLAFCNSMSVCRMHHNVHLLALLTTVFHCFRLNMIVGHESFTVF